MLKSFLPSEHVKSIFDIKPEDLKKRGVKGIITDLDNTLSRMGSSHCHARVNSMV